MISGLIKPGARVVLKSGGPPMLVLAVGDDIAFVRWFDDKTREQEAQFQVSALAVIEENALNRSQSLFSYFRRSRKSIAGKSKIKRKARR
jgi:uncharacterized protein YodC (DUF2158 family)